MQVARRDTEAANRASMAGQNGFRKTDNIKDRILTGIAFANALLGEGGQMRYGLDLNFFSIVIKTRDRDLAAVEIQRSDRPQRTPLTCENSSMDAILDGKTRDDLT